MLQGLSGHDLNKIDLMVQSPFFNKSPEVQRLFHVLMDEHPDFMDERVNKSDIFQRIVPGSAYDDQQMRYWMSDLTKIVEQYITWRQLEEEQVLSQHLLIKGMQDKQLNALIPRSIERSFRLLKKYPFQDQKKYFDQFLLERDSYEFVASRRNLAVKETLQRLLSSLDYYYITNKLKFSAELINHTNVMAGAYEPMLLEEITAFIQREDLQEVPVVRIYYFILKMLAHPEQEDYYQQLKGALQKAHDLFPKRELNDMYIFARNYCARQINSGNTKYLREIFELYQTLSENEIIFQDGYLSQWDYKNMTAVGLRLEEYKWVRDFIENYKEKLPPEDRDNAYSYNKALYHYHLKDYDKTLELLRDVEFTDVYYHLDYKSLLVKTYYATEEFEALHSLMDTFYVYLRRNKLISDYNKESYNNFLKVVKKLIRVRYKSPGKIDEFERQLNDIRPIANLSWIQKKLADLK